MERAKSIKEIYALKLFSSDAYLTVNKQLLQQYGPNVAVFLSNLIDKYQYFLEEGQTVNGEWFYLLHEQQTAQTGLTDHQIRTCKNLLVKAKLLETRRLGVPSKEFYRINLELLVNNTVGLVLEKFKGYTYIYNKEPKYIILPNKKPSRKERSEVYLPLAQKLSKIICTVKNIKHTPQQIQTWAYSICQLVEDGGVSYERIEEALEWYSHHAGGQYIPVIESGSSLKEKFLRLESAMKRIELDRVDEQTYVSSSELPDKFRNRYD